MYKRVGNKWKMLRNVCPLRNKPCLRFFRSRRFRREMGIVKSGVVGECRMCFFVSQNTAALCSLPFFFSFSRRPKREEGALFLSFSPNSGLPHHSYPEIGCTKRHHSCHTTHSDRLNGVGHLQVMTDTDICYNDPVASGGFTAVNLVLPASSPPLRQWAASDGHYVAL